MTLKTYKYKDFYKKRCESKQQFMGRINQELLEYLDVHILNVETRYSLKRFGYYFRFWFLD